MEGFLSTPSARRATPEKLDEDYRVIFLSTPSARRATTTWKALCFRSADFYPRPPRGGRLFFMEHFGVKLVISIHALREEGDSCASPP